MSLNAMQDYFTVLICFAGVPMFAHLILRLYQIIVMSASEITFEGSQVHAIDHQDCSITLMVSITSMISVLRATKDYLITSMNMEICVVY